MTLGRFQRSRRIVQTRLTPYRAMLGDGNGNIKAGDGMYWVRPYDAANEQNIATPGTPYRVRAGSALIVPREGRLVWIYYGPDKRLTVMAYDHDDLIQAGIDPLTVQPNDPYRTWIRLKNIQNFRALPIGTGNTPSMKVQVRQLFYYTETGDLVRWNGTNADTHIDVTDYVPADGFQCYIVLWLRVYNPNGLPPIQVTYSDHIDSIDDVLSFDELQQCADMADPDTVPIQAFRLANAQTTLKIDDSVDVDLRQFINMPQVWGFPNTVDRAYRIHEGFSVVAPSAITIEDGGVVQVQDNALLLILGADEEESGGGGGMTSFNVIADDVTAFVIADGNTLDFAGAGGIVTSVDPITKKVFIDGSALGYIWNVNADNDDVQPVFASDIVNILGGTGIETAIVSGPDITVAVDSTVIRTAGTQSIGAGLTIDTPTIGDFTNANHDHLDADDGGTLSTGIFGTTTQNWVLIGQISGTGVPTFRGLNPADLASPLSTPPSIGGSTPGTVYSSAFRLYIGGFAAIFTHAFTANRTVTFPGDANVSLVGEATTQTLTNKTLTQPVIADFTSAQHDHADADDGGNITGAAFGTQTANTVLSGPTSGGAANPTFRALGLADVPNLIAIIRDEKTSGTNGGSSAATTWNNRDLNTELYDPGGIVSIASNQFTPIAGDYEITIFTPFAGNLSANALGRCRLYNVTGAAAVEEGQNTFALTNGPATATLTCKFTANGTDAYRIDTYTSTARVTTGLGAQVGDGSAEVYTCVYLRKIA